MAGMAVGVMDTCAKVIQKIIYSSFVDYLERD